MAGRASTRAVRTVTHARGEESVHYEQRLEQLMEASATVVQRLDLEAVLRRIVEAAMKLVGARYGALGVIALDGGLERFIHVGFDRHTVDRIGHLPEGHGVLGAVIVDRQPIRLDHLADDPRSAGFPDNHPGMESFLGVPVRVGDEVYGNLYLTESASGSFTTEDQRLIEALAGMAGIAIENARLYEIARTREAWNATIADVMSAMLDVSGENVLDVIAERVASLTDADLVAVAEPRGEEKLAITAVYGTDATNMRGRVYRRAGTLAARALAGRQAISIDGQAAATLFEWQPGIGPTVAIPLIAGDEPLGVLTVSRRLDGAPFTAADLEMAFAFAAQASIALEVVRGREDRRRLDTSRDRARIARDLHDHVIQRLFGAGLALQSASAVAGQEAAATIDAQIDIIDEAIRDIRSSVFALSSGERRGASRLRDRLLDVVAEVTGKWSAPPRITFAGPLDNATDPSLANDVVATVRELLTNVAKHADASVVRMDLSLAHDEVHLAVRDDGRGMPPEARLSGLKNLSDRAALRGGRSSIRSLPEGGTLVEWSVPVQPPLDPQL